MEDSTSISLFTIVDTSTLSTRSLYTLARTPTTTHVHSTLCNRGRPEILASNSRTLAFPKSTRVCPLRSSVFNPSYTIYPNCSRHSDDTTAYFYPITSTQMSHQNQLSDDSVAIHNKLSSRFASLRMFKLKSGSGSSGAWRCSRSVPVYSRSSSLNALHCDRLISVSPTASPAQGQRVRLFTQFFKSTLCDL